MRFERAIVGTVYFKAAQDSNYIGGHPGLRGQVAISGEKTTAKR